MFKKKAIIRDRYLRFLKPGKLLWKEKKFELKKYNLKDWKAYMKEAESKFHFFQTGKVFLLSKKEKIGDDPKPSSRCLHSHDGQDFTTRPACLSVSKHEWKRTANLGEMRNLGTSCRKIWQRVVKSGEAMKGRQTPTSVF